MQKLYYVFDCPYCFWPAPVLFSQQEVVLGYGKKKGYASTIVELGEGIGRQSISKRSLFVCKL